MKNIEKKEIPSGIIAGKISVLVRSNKTLSSPGSNWDNFLNL